MDALALGGDEGRDRLRYAWARSQISYDPGISEWGNPHGFISMYPLAEYIGFRRRTEGSETSQYLQEKKSIEIPVVAASEPGIGQTTEFRLCGVVGLIMSIHD